MLWGLFSLQDSTNGLAGASEPSTSATTNTALDDDIMKTLLAHEKKSSAVRVAGVPASDDDASSSSDSEDDNAAPTSNKQPDYLTPGNDIHSTNQNWLVRLLSTNPSYIPSSYFCEKIEIDK